MATTSLGRLTLDLAVKLSDYVDGMTRAERETKDKTEKMNRSVTDFKTSLLDSLNGTEVGAAFKALDGNFKSAGSIASAAGLALGGVGVAATGAIAGLTRLALETAKADADLAKLAQTAGTGVENFQTLAHAAKQYGIDQGQLSSILADVQEKLGEFTSTGGGGAADFFDQLKVRTGETDEAMQSFAQTLQGKDGVDAIRTIKDQMDDWGITTQEQRFILESLGSDLGNLQPILGMTASEWDTYGQSLEDAGIVKTQEAINNSVTLEQHTRALTDAYGGVRNKLAGAVIPVLAELATELTKTKTGTDDLKGSLSGVDSIIEVVRKAFVGASAETQLWALDLQALSFQLGNFKSFLYELGSTTTFGDMYDTYQKYNKLSMERHQADTRRREVIQLREQAAKNNLGSVYGLITGTGGIKTPTGQTTPTGKTGATLAQEFEEMRKAEDKKAKEKAKEDEKTIKAAKELGAAYVSNTELKGLKLKSNEAIGGGKARGYTAEFAHLTQNILGNDLKYFSAINDRYHKGTNSKHTTGQAFDVVLKDAKKAKQAVAEIKAAAKEYGYQVKVLDEYSRPSKNATGGHLHVSVYGQTAAKNGGADIKWIKQQASEREKAQEQAARDAQRAQEERERLQTSIAYRYASEREKDEIEHLKRIEEINKAHGAGTAKAKEYIAQENEAYQEAINAKALSVVERYYSKERQLTLDHEAAMKAIKENVDPNTPDYQLALEAQEAYYQKELALMRHQDGEKYRQTQKHIADIRQLMEQGTGEASARIRDGVARSTMSTGDYALYSLSNEQRAATGSADNVLAQRQSAINERDGNGEFVIQDAQERSRLLEEAKREHEFNMWSIEEEYSGKRKELQQQEAAARAQAMGEMFSGMTDMTAMFFGEQSKEHRAAMAAQRAFAIAQVLMNAPKTASDAYAALAPIPIVGPALGIAAAATAITTQLGYAAQLKSTSVAGIAHGGLDYVPSESTYLLDKGERVLSPNQNSDLTKFMQNGGKGSPQINIINNAPGYEAVTHTNADGSIDVRIEKRLKQSWSNLQNPNSHESKMVNRSLQAPRRR